MINEGYAVWANRMKIEAVETAAIARNKP